MPQIVFPPETRPYATKHTTRISNNFDDAQKFPFFKNHALIYASRWPSQSGIDLQSARGLGTLTRHLSIHMYGFSIFIRCLLDPFFI